MFNLRTIIIIISIIFLIPIVIAEETRDENYNNLQNLLIEIEISGGIESVKTSSDSVFKRLNADLILFPRQDERQQIISLDSSSIPISKIKEDNTISYEWEEFSDKFNFNLKSNTKTSNIFYKVPRLKFPIANLDEDIKKYTEPTEYIDLNQDIINKAAEIVEGETDLFTAVFKIADWTKNNIEYDLNTLTEEVVQKSSWVLDNKVGVCDEMTSLFISMLRSVGIPARFVTGMVYTNLNYEWGAHGWAEVYFPEIGWVPFDVTFGQYGWIDPSHLKLADNFDSKDPAVRYLWESRNVDMKIQSLSIETNLVSKSNEISPVFEIQAEALANKVGPGSYVPVQVTITNPNNYFLSNSLTVIAAPGLVGNNFREILLKPKQQKSIFWIVKIPEEVDEIYLYTTKFKVIDLFGSEAYDDIEYAAIYNTNSLEDAESVIKILSEEEEKTYSIDLQLNCSTVKPYYYTYETPEIKCNLKNTGNTILKDLNICLEENCNKFDLIIGQEREINFILNEVNQNRFLINAKNSDLDLNNIVILKLFEEPDLRINNLEIPKEVNYKEIFELNFDLTSETLIKDLSIKINNLDIIKIDEFQNSDKIKIQAYGKDFSNGKIQINLNYKDENGKSYSQYQEYTIKVINIPFFKKIILFFRNLF